MLERQKIYHDHPSMAVIQNLLFYNHHPSPRLWPKVRKLPDELNGKNKKASVPKLLVAATQPKSGGIAPGKAPTKTAKGVTSFKGVYTMV